MSSANIQLRPLEINFEKRRQIILENLVRMLTNRKMLDESELKKNIATLVNTDSDDFTYFSNRYEQYQRWSGAYTQLNGALAGGETSVTVDSVLTDPIYYSATATGSSATTLTR